MFKLAAIGEWNTENGDRNPRENLKVILIIAVKL